MKIVEANKVKSFEKTLPKDTPLSERELVNINIRADTISKMY